MNPNVTRIVAITQVRSLATVESVDQVSNVRAEALATEERRSLLAAVASSKIFFTLTYPTTAETGQVHRPNEKLTLSTQNP